MDESNKTSYEFYKRKRILPIVCLFLFLVIFSIDVIQGILEKSYIISIIFLIILVLYLFVITIAIIQYRSVEKAPGVVLGDKEIKARIGVLNKIQVINLNEVKKIEVPRYEECVILHLENKIISIYLNEYKAEDRKVIKEAFNSIKKCNVNVKSINEGELI